MSIIQEIFDTAAVGLLTQKSKSEVHSDHCMYRGPEGKKCAIGFCISDEDYDPSMEEKPIGRILDRYEGPSIKKLSGVNRAFLTRLQRIHDSDSSPEEWKEKLISLAQGYNLSTSAIDNL